MRCEACGCRINGKPFNVIIEGAKLTVCTECSKLGEICHDEPKQKVPGARFVATQKPQMLQTKKPQTPKVDTSLELVENYDAKIRQAREKLGLSHEDLGRKINEKVSLLRKIETGKMTPDNRLAIMLEHALKIRLIVPAKEEKILQAKAKGSVAPDLTLGDIIHLDKKGASEEDTAGRKQS